MPSLTRDELLAFRRVTDEVAHCGRQMAEYCREHDIADVVLVDGPARLAHVALRESWRLRFAEAPPRCHFLNLMPLYDLVERPLPNESEEEAGARLGRQLTEEMPLLAACASRPTLLFDAYAHQEEPLMLANLFLQTLEFSELHTGTYATCEHTSPRLQQRLDLTVAEEEPIAGLFGECTAMILPPDSFRAQPGDPEALRCDRRTRRFLRNLVRAEFAYHAQSDL